MKHFYKIVAQLCALLALCRAATALAESDYCDLCDNHIGCNNTGVSKDFAVFN